MPPDHPLLYKAFLTVSDRLAGHYDQRKAGLTNPQAIQDLDRQTAQIFRVKAAELTALFQATRTANAQIKAVEQDLRAHANQRAKFEQFPVPSVVQALHAKRDQIVSDTIIRLKAILTAESWNGLSSYINESIRDSYTVVPLSGR